MVGDEISNLVVLSSFMCSFVEVGNSEGETRVAVGGGDELMEYYQSH